MTIIAAVRSLYVIVCYSVRPGVGTHTSVKIERVGARGVSPCVSVVVSTAFTRRGAINGALLPVLSVDILSCADRAA